MDENIKNEIKELFNDLDYFSSLLIKIKIADIEFEKIHYEKDRVVTDIILTDKKYYSTSQEAFAAIFKKNLYDIEEWNIKDEINEDNRAKVAMKEYWIQEYFLHLNELRIESVEIGEYEQLVRGDFLCFRMADEKMEIFLDELKVINIIQIKRDYFQHMFFGMTDKFYFTYEFFMGD